MDQTQKLYRDSSSQVRASFGSNAAQAAAYYQAFVSFVLRVAPPAEGTATKLLDVGCGSGWSTYLFAEAGYTASGIDLNPLAFEAPPHPRCTVSAGSAMDMDLPPESFDVVVSYQCLEHIPDPAKALDEMVRMCRPGGTVAIVGPNLLSPAVGLLFALKPSSWRQLRLRRQAGMAKHPYGNTVPEILMVCLRRSWELFLAVTSPQPQFLMRAPDSVPPFHADNDACYLCNPTDLVRYFQRRGFRVVCRGRPGRPAFSYLFAGGTWVAARRSSS
jgi:SAM-dependent methyltransferase